MWRIIPKINLRLFQEYETVIAYYFFITLIALATFMLLLFLRKFFSFPSLRAIFSSAFLVFFVSSLFPGLISALPPLFSFLLVGFLAYLGGCLLSRKFTFSVEEQTLQYSPGTGSKSSADEEEKEEKLLSVPGRQRDKLKREEGVEANKSLIPLRSGETKRKEVMPLPPEERDLKDLINGAFQAREEKNLNLAIELFKRALALTGDIILKGMIYMELVNLYKEQGKYLEAAGLLEGFITENSAALLPSLKAHFSRMVLHLQTLDELLKKAEHPAIPYSEVPRLIRLRAEQILKE